MLLHFGFADWDGDGSVHLLVAVKASGRRKGPCSSARSLATKATVRRRVAELARVRAGQARKSGDFGYWGLSTCRSPKHLEEQGTPPSAIYWSRNTATKGEPKFAAGSLLLSIPAPRRIVTASNGTTVFRAIPLHLNAFSIVDWGHDGRLDIVVALTKIRPRKEGGSYVDGQLWLYRRKS
jgi:hypothetical protein